MISYRGQSKILTPSDESVHVLFIVIVLHMSIYCAHSVCKNNRPLTDFIWLCQLDKVKGLDIADTYMNEKAATNFIKYNKLML
jgi:hypothetical protein